MSTNSRPSRTSPGAMRRRVASRRRGSALIEFAMVALLLIMTLFAMIEVNRLFLVTTALADCARAGLRYAIVHGSDNPATATDVTNMVKYYAGAAMLDTNRLVVTLTPSDPSTLAPGSTLQIDVKYPYDPLTSYFSFSINLDSSAQGVVAF